MASDVERIHHEYTLLLEMLVAAEEISLQATTDDSFRKMLLLSAASYFEHRLTEIVTSFVDEITASNGLVISLVKQKAVERQYHTWFDWKEKNANSFYSLFGDGFKSHMKVLIKSSPELDNSVKAFLEIGQQRNRLVHQSFASFSLEKTSVEIFNLYKSALVFVETLGVELRNCSGTTKFVVERSIW